MVVDPDGYIVTNYHVVSQAESIQVQLSDGRRVPASVVGADAHDRFGRAEGRYAPNLIAADWGDSDELQVGDLVWALGSPYGLDHSLTFGIVSAKARRSGTRFTRSPYQEYLQTDAAVNPGNSGGPLVNIEGADRRHQRGHLRLFVPGHQLRDSQRPGPREVRSTAHQRLDRTRLAGHHAPRSARRGTHAARPRLGRGVYVGGVQEGGPADRAGIRRGDVILTWNEQQATDPTLVESGDRRHRDRLDRQGRVGASAKRRRPRSSKST